MGACSFMQNSWLCGEKVDPWSGGDGGCTQTTWHGGKEKKVLLTK